MFLEFASFAKPLYSWCQAQINGEGWIRKDIDHQTFAKSNTRIIKNKIYKLDRLTVMPLANRVLLETATVGQRQRTRRGGRHGGKQ